MRILIRLSPQPEMDISKRLLALLPYPRLVPNFLPLSSNCLNISPWDHEYDQKVLTATKRYLAYYRLNASGIMTGGFHRFP